MQIFDYDNILLLPRKCRVESRSECDASVELGESAVWTVLRLQDYPEPLELQHLPIPPSYWHSRAAVLTIARIAHFCSKTTTQQDPTILLSVFTKSLEKSFFNPSTS